MAEIYGISKKWVQHSSHMLYVMDAPTPTTKRRAQILILLSMVIVIMMSLHALLAHLISSSSTLLPLEESNHLLQRHRRRLFGFHLFSDPKTVELRSGGITTPAVELFVNSTYDEEVCEEGIDRLTEAIKSDLDKFSLRPIYFSVNEKQFYFGGLDLELIHRVLLGKEIAILGDSTLRNLFTWLQFLLIMTVTSHLLLVEGRLSTMNLSNAVKATQGPTDLELDSFHHFPPMDSPVGYSVGYAWARTHIDYALQYLTIYKPKVVIANIGLHLLHIQNHDHDKGYKEVELWLNYEKILEQIVIAAETAGVETLVLKTNNFICDEKYIDNFAKGISLYSAQNMRVINQCVASITQKEQNYKSSSGISITVQDIQNYCTNAVLNEKGSSGLNERLYRFVDARRKQQHQSISTSPSIKLVIFNDHKLQSCETTGIGNARHHHILNLARIRLLANLLDCMHE